MGSISIELDLPEWFQVKLALQLQIANLEKRIEYYQKHKTPSQSESLEIVERELNECRSALNKIK